ncbi:hypothetical protein HPP92_005217 [Vanilla planifolia]|uniref:Uncharacterized protein n=1 Tax=Vanilla planifolia TaxID=51239 RepID=A0A835RMI4_VANPL|nr:hypothetical protein HPP92_005217 [Vanilla planifolia]
MTVPSPNIEKTHSRSFDVKNLETRNVEPEVRLSGCMDNKSSHVACTDAQASSLNEDELSKRNSSFKTKYDDGDDFRVPTFVQSEAIPCSKSTIVEVSVRGSIEC